jgi:hypothetical protein
MAGAPLDVAVVGAGAETLRPVREDESFRRHARRRCLAPQACLDVGLLTLAGIECPRQVVNVVI